VTAGDEQAKLLAALDTLPLGHSRIGGLPDLPRKKKWPEHKGKKLPFIAQLNLAQLPKTAHALLPRDGHLYVFARISNAEKQWPPPVSICVHRCKAEALVRSIQNQTATVQSVLGLDWASFDPNVSLFGTLDPSVCLPGDQRDEEQASPGC